MEYLTSQLNMAKLPEMIRQTAMVADNPQQSDMLLLATLTALSSVMPHCVLEHGYPSHTYYPNLMTLVCAPPASGKGVMNLVRSFLNKIQEEKRNASDSLLLLNNEEKDQTLFIPGNSSAAAFFKLLHDNNGKGFMMETEMDVLTAAWKNNFSNYSYALRQAYEHETISQARKTDRVPFVEIPNPQLSVLLSGTFNQLQPLLISQENGLASRFLCYMVDGVIPFDPRAIHHPDDKTESETQILLNDLNNKVYDMYHWLRKQKHDCHFRLTAEQSEQLRSCFHDWYLIATDLLALPMNIDPIIKRHAATIMRIGLILSIVRYYETNVANTDSTKLVLPESLYCTDNDFETLCILGRELLVHAGKMMLMLPTNCDQPISNGKDKLTELLAALPDNFTSQQAIKAGMKLDLVRRTIEKYLVKAQQDNLIVKVGRARYEKK